MQRDEENGRERGREGEGINQGISCVQSASLHEIVGFYHIKGHECQIKTLVRQWCSIDDDDDDDVATDSISLLLFPSYTDIKCHIIKYAHHKSRIRACHWPNREEGQTEKIEIEVQWKNIR